LLPAGPPDESARFPLAPRRPSWLKFGLRIIVPGPLRFRRLAVPQTSWNLLHYAPAGLFRQRFFDAGERFSSAFMFLFFNQLHGSSKACPVDKTLALCPAFAIL
jgi:hypothetical protein